MDAPGFDATILIQRAALAGANEGDDIFASQTGDCRRVEMVQMTVGAGIHVYLNLFRGDKDWNSATQVNIGIAGSATVRQVEVDRY